MQIADKAAHLRNILSTLSPNDQNFVGSLLEAFYGTRGASEKQIYWIGKKYDDLMARKAAAVAVREEITLPRIAALIHLAMSKGVETPTIRLRIPDDKGRFAIRGVRTKRGELIAYINDRDRTFTTRDGAVRKQGYGQIDLISRKLTASTYADPAILPLVLDAIKAFEADPHMAGALEGHATGACCFCGLKLTNAPSVAAGYGPICADNYGLPWGAGNNKTNVAKALGITEGEKIAEEFPDFDLTHMAANGIVSK
jgi:hypothetical protein